MQRLSPPILCLSPADYTHELVDGFMCVKDFYVTFVVVVVQGRISSVDTKPALQHYLSLYQTASVTDYWKSSDGII